MRGTITNIEQKTTKEGTPWWSLEINGEKVSTFDKNIGNLKAGDTIEYNTHQTKSKDGKYTFHNLDEGWKKVVDLNGNERSMIAMNALKSAVTLAASRSVLTPEEAADFTVKCFVRFHDGLLQTIKGEVERTEREPEPEPEPNPRKVIKGESGKLYTEAE